MVVTVRNEQREAPVRIAQMTRLARCAVRRLRIRAQGTLAITFIDARRMRALNRRFLDHDRATDVLSFRYDLPAPARGRQAGDEPIVGDIVISPAAARAYAKVHATPYRKELARYV